MWENRRWKFEIIVPYIMEEEKRYILAELGMGAENDQLESIEWETHFVQHNWIKHSYKKILDQDTFRTQRFIRPVCQSMIWENLYLNDGKCV